MISGSSNAKKGGSMILDTHSRLGIRFLGPHNVMYKNSSTAAVQQTYDMAASTGLFETLSSDRLQPSMRAGLPSKAD